MLENSLSRKIYGFDTFGEFPEATISEDVSQEISLSKKQVIQALLKKNFMVIYKN